METLASWADYWDQSCNRKEDVIKKFDDVIYKLEQNKVEFVERGSTTPDIKAVAHLIELIASHDALEGAIRLVRAACKDKRTVKSEITDAFLEILK